MTSEYKEFPDYVPDDGITAAELVSGELKNADFSVSPFSTMSREKRKDEIKYKICYDVEYNLLTYLKLK